MSTSVKLEAAPIDVGDDSMHSAAVRARIVARTCDQTATFATENKPQLSEQVDLFRSSSGNASLA